MLRFLSLVALALIALLPLACEEKKSTGAAASAKTSSRKTMSPEEFEKAVKGKSMNEVVAAVGQPDYKTGAAGKEEWLYAGIAMDAAASKPYEKTTVYFDSGRVVRVAHGKSGE